MSAMIVDPELAVEIRRALIAHQGSRTDAEMAGEMGVTREHWWHIKNGSRRPSYALIKRAARRYPDLTVLVLRDLTDEVPA
jgi:transcriptional regulator with XRE-family HTH domain